MLILINSIQKLSFKVLQENFGSQRSDNTNIINVEERLLSVEEQKVVGFNKYLGLSIKVVKRILSC